MTDHHRPTTSHPSALPGTDETPTPGHCPSCGRFVGPYERCPYCGAAVGQRMAVRVFKYGSLVLAIVGVVVLLVVARRSQVPIVELGNLTGTMNWAYVRVEGVVTRQPALDREAGTLRLWVGDHTGEIMVLAYRSEATWLSEQGLVPVMGDTVTLEGTLRIKEDLQYLVVNVPEHTQVWPGEPVELPISQVGDGQLYQKVTVRGAIRKDRTPYTGLRILTVRDSSGEIDVALWSEALSLGGALPGLHIGQPIQVTGAIDAYRGSPQISVGRSSDLVVLDEPVAVASEHRIDQLSSATIGQMVVVEGTIAEVQPFSAGVKLTMDDGSGTVTALLWQDLHDSLTEREALVKGAQVRTIGRVAEYRGELEVIPELPSDVMLVSPASVVVSERQLGELSAADLGQRVRVEAVIKSLRTFSGGLVGTLDDGTGTTLLLLWQEVCDGLNDPAELVPGAVLRVEGEVVEYQGQMEIVPRASADLTVVGMVELPVQEAAIGQLSADDLGQTVQVDGRIVAIAPFSKGTKYTLDDGTGTITLLLWQNVYDRQADPDLLAVDTWLRVRGTVAEYLGDLELVPQLRSDLKVTEAAQAPVLTPSPSPEPTSRPTGEPETPQALTATAPPSPPPPTPSPSPEIRKIGAISSSDVGAILTIAQAGIADLDYFSAGIKYTLTDGTGQIILLIWQNVLEEIDSRYVLFPGSQVRITGEIDEYQGDLEIMPQHGSDLVVLDPGQRLPVEERSIANISPADEGRIFVVEGRVMRIESNRWLWVWINDGSGELLIFAPERVVQYLPEGLGQGVRLKVTGEVDIYRGQLEIIPLTGSDVEVR